MSCFVLSKKHIDALVTAFCTPQRTWPPGTWSKPNEDEIGQILQEQNLACFFKRCEKLSAKVPPPYTFSRHELTPVEVLKACQCYKYNSFDYDRGRAGEIIDILFFEAIEKLPGYRDAEWSIGEHERNEK